MKTILTLLWAAAAVAYMSLLGCDIDIGRSSEPVYVEHSQPQPDYVVVREAPPAVIVERRSPQPSGEYVWIDGYWHWSGHEYVWQGGHWARPPQEHYIWIAPRYEQHDHDYRYVPGQWREDQQDRRRDDEHRDRR